jgi:hypothetical protein
MTERVSAQEFAALIGVSAPAVTKALKSGRLSKSAKKDGRFWLIDPVVGRREWDANNGRPDLSGVDHKSVSVRMDRRGPDAPKRQQLQVPATPMGEDEPDLDEFEDGNGVKIPSSIRSRQIIDYYKSETARLEHEKRRGELVEVAEVAKIVGDEYTAVRTRLLAIPTELADELKLISDPIKIRQLIESAIHEALQELTADDDGLQQRAA